MCNGTFICDQQHDYEAHIGPWTDTVPNIILFKFLNETKCINSNFEINFRMLFLYL